MSESPPTDKNGVEMARRLWHRRLGLAGLPCPTADMCTAFDEGYLAALALNTPASAGRLTKPAQVGNTVFREGVAEQLVIDRAHREFEYQQTPEKEAARLKRFDEFREAMGKAETDPRPVVVDPEIDERMAAIVAPSSERDTDWKMRAETAETTLNYLRSMKKGAHEVGTVEALREARRFIAQLAVGGNQHAGRLVSQIEAVLHGEASASSATSPQEPAIKMGGTKEGE